MSRLHPSLTNLPVEIRHQILQNVLGDEYACIIFKAKYHEYTRKSIDTDGTTTTTVYGLRKEEGSQYPSHPLLSICRVIREDAQTLLRIFVTIRRIDLIYSEERGGTKTVRGLKDFADLDRDTVRVDASLNKDDINSVLLPWMLKSVRRIALQSCLGLDGKYINRVQFPNLDNVGLYGFIKKGSKYHDVEKRSFETRNWTAGVFCFSRDSQRTIADYFEAKYDEDITDMMIKMRTADIINIGSRDERGFDIVLVVRLDVWYLSPQSDATAIQRGQMHIAIDFDKRVVNHRWNPRVTYRERERHPGRFDESWKLFGTMDAGRNERNWRYYKDKSNDLNTW